MGRTLLFAGFLSLGFCGCDSGSAVPATVTDSAGVTVTLSRSTPRIFAEVGPEPVLSLGGPDAEGPTQFFQIQDVYVDSRQRLWVTDGQSSELRIFLSDGTHFRTVGGRGEGPGEFQRLRFLGSFRGDSIALWDLGLARLTVLDAEGNLARTEQVVPNGAPSIRCSRVFEDGSLLGQVPTILPAGSLEPGQILGDSVHLVRFSPRDSTQRTWANAVGPQWLWTGRSQVPVPFTANASFDLRGEELHLVSGTEFRVQVFEAGELIRIYGVDQDRRKAGAEDIEAYREFVKDFIPENARDEYLLPLGSPDLPRYLPAYSQLLVSSPGAVWVREYSPNVLDSGTWHVFDEEGVFLGSVETPRGLSVRFVGAHEIAGIWRDDTGVEHVRVHRLAIFPPPSE